MRGAFIFYDNIDVDNQTGIEKKVLTQIDEFNNNGFECNIVTMSTVKNGKFDAVIKKILSTFPNGNYYPTWEYKDELINLDFVYLRRPLAVTKQMLKVLSKIKDLNPGVKIILEIPNYPYDKEITISWKYYLHYLKDKLNRKKLHKIVDRIAVQSDVEQIFNIPTIRFLNGIRVNDINIRKPEESINDEINICAVASLEPWQGYERIIKGLYNYYHKGGTRKINIHIVGDGVERTKYEKLVIEYNLGDNVLFYGKIYGDQLSHIYDICDLALDAFGRYKTNNNISTSLKSREYLAKGLPIISGSKIDILSGINYPYYLEFNGDDSIIPIESIIEFYDSIYINTQSKVEITENIRKFAYEVCDISFTMRNIINYINS